MKKSIFHTSLVGLFWVSGCQFTPSTQILFPSFQPVTASSAVPLSGSLKELPKSFAELIFTPDSINSSGLSLIPSYSFFSDITKSGYSDFRKIMTDKFVISCEKAVYAGFTASYEEISPKIEPIISSWSDDAKLENIQSAIYSSEKDKSSWYLHYRSDKLSSELEINVKSTETVFIKTTYSSINIDTEKIKIDSDIAMEKVKSAITNHFFLPESCNSSIYTESSSSYPSLTSEVAYLTSCDVLYEIDSNMYMSLNLYDKGGKLYWIVSFGSKYNTPVKTSNGLFAKYYDGKAVVDTESGEVTEIYRMRRILLKSNDPSFNPQNYFRILP